MARLFAIFVLSCASLMAQEQQPAPAAPPDSGQPQAGSAPTQQTDEPADPNKLPRPKKGVKQRIKDQVKAPWCVHIGTGACRDVGGSKESGDKDKGEQAADQQPQPQPGPGPNQAPPRSDTQPDANSSSSRENRIDLSPPPGDTSAHPESSTTPDVTEFHPYDPHRAAKNNEVGDYYLTQRNYKAAISRYEEALQYKPNDAYAIFRLGETYDKMGQPPKAREYYERYLKILPRGEKAADARKAIKRLGGDPGVASSSGPAVQADEAKPADERSSDLCVISATRTCRDKLPNPVPAGGPPK